MRKLLALVVLVSVFSCKKAAPPPPVVSIDVAAVNAVVPEPFRAKLVFEKRDLPAESMRGKTVFTVAAPKSWVLDEFQLPDTASLHPPYGMDSGYGNGTALKLSSACGGLCEEKDWAKVAAENLSRFGSPPKILRDEKTATSLLRVAEADLGLYFEYSFWYPGATQYFECNVTLLREAGNDEAPDPRTALAPFEQACKAVNVALAKP